MISATKAAVSTEGNSIVKASAAVKPLRVGGSIVLLMEFSDEDVDVGV